MHLCKPAVATMRMRLGLVVCLLADVHAARKRPAISVGDPSSSDYYAVLGLDRDASAKALKTAYRKAALKWHPDKSDDPKAEEYFRNVAEAYEVLSDAGRRARYDRMGKGAAGASGFSRGSGMSQFRNARDVFKDMFGDKDPFANFDELFDEVEEQEIGVEVESAASKPGRRGSRSPGAGFGGGGSSSFSFSFSSSSSSGGSTRQYRTQTSTDSTGRRVTKTLSSDGDRTEATIDERLPDGTTKRKRGVKRGGAAAPRRRKEAAGIADGGGSDAPPTHAKKRRRAKKKGGGKEEL